MILVYSLKLNYLYWVKKGKFLGIKPKQNLGKIYNKSTWLLHYVNALSPTNFPTWYPFYSLIQIQNVTQTLVKNGTHSFKCVWLFLFFPAMLEIKANEISLIFVFFRYILNVFIFSGDYMETYHIKYLFVRLLRKLLNYYYLNLEKFTIQILKLDMPWFRTKKIIK